MSDADEKAVAFYGAAIEAWLATKFEKDRSLLLLATGGLGVLVTLLTTIGVASSWLLWINGAAILAFLICIGLVLCIFDANAKYLEQVITTGVREKKRELARLDCGAYTSFLAGVVLAATIAFASAFISSKERSMSERRNLEVKKSFNGFGALQPNPSDAGSSKPKSDSTTPSGSGSGSGNPAPSPTTTPEGQTTTTPER